jgi:hypothetical protein
MAGKVTDPALLEKLNSAPVLAPGPRKPVDDPALLHKLNGGTDDDYLDDADLVLDDGREVIRDTDERAGLPIPGTVSELEASGADVSNKPSRRFGLGQSDTLNPLPAVAALGDQFFREIPIIGPHLGNMRDQLNANIYGGTPEEARADIAETVRQNPTPAKIGQAFGQASPYLAAAAVGGPLAGALGMEGTILSRIIMGSISNEAIKFGDKVAEGEAPLQALGNATRETLIEAPFFAFGTKAGRQATIANAPKTTQLFEEGNQLFERVKDSKLVIAQPSADSFINSTTSKAMSSGLDQDLTPGATAVVKRLQGMAGRNMSIEDAMLVRKLANDAYTNAKIGSNDARIARGIVADLDQFLEGVATKGPQGQPNMAVVSGDPDMAKTLLQEANAVWSSASKAKAIDQSIELAVAEAEKSGRSLDATLKTEFGRIEREIIKGNPERFTDEEIALIKEVARGNGARNLAGFLGRTLYPNGPFSAIATMGATLGTGASAFLGSGGDVLQTAAASAVPMVLGAAGRGIAGRSAKGSADYTSAAIRDNVLGGRYSGGSPEVSPMLSALPQIAGRTATTMTLEEYTNQGAAVR